MSREATRQASIGSPLEAVPIVRAKVTVTVEADGTTTTWTIPECTGVDYDIRREDPPFIRSDPFAYTAGSRV